jgi:alkylated DNA repair dioxygenase AlkB
MNRKHHDTLHEISLDANGELESVLSRVIARLDLKALAQQFREQDGFAFVENFLTEDELSKYFLPSVESAKPYIHRNYIPLHKKGGSISSFSIAQNAPTFSDLYRSRTFGDFITQLTSSEKKLLLCPPQDAHAVALYFYTEAGDHIGWHYDSSFYDGKRFTVLLGLVDNSSCELVCEL